MAAVVNYPRPRGCVVSFLVADRKGLSGCCQRNGLLGEGEDKVARRGMSKGCGTGVVGVLKRVSARDGRESGDKA